MDLDRRYDGPVPPADPADLGRPRLPARARLFERLCGDARRAAAVRRAGLAGAAAPADARLARQAARLGVCRGQGRAWWEVAHSRIR